ncbi:MAG: Glycosyl transferase, group 1 family protein [uncultured bacterium]|nr:MAG: Glycosyl transferase, group 1 family protein [uncultured bacterium]
MKVLAIAPEPFYSPRGTPFSVYYRALITSQLGLGIDLLTYGEGEDVVIPGVNIIRIPRFSLLGKVKVGPSPLKLFLDIFLIIYTIRLLLKNHYEVVHAHEEAVFFCRFLKPVFRFKLIYDMHSSLPQQLTNFQFTTSRLLIGIFKMLEDSCLKKADAIITICPDLADYVNRLLNNPDKHFLIENSIFDPIQLAGEQAGAGVGSEPQDVNLPANVHSIVYAGTLEPYQGIDILIEAFRIFHANHPEYKLLIAGGNSGQVEKYRQVARNQAIDEHCIFTGQVSQAKAKFYCSQAKVLVSPRANGTNTPLKVYEQLASGIPLVATRIYSHTQVLNDDVAILVAPNPEDFARGLAAATDGLGKERAKNAKELYGEKYSREIYTGKMKNLFTHLDHSARV